jgi:hypothetical protein
MVNVESAPASLRSVLYGDVVVVVVVVVSVWDGEGVRSLGETAVPECLGVDGRMSRR